MSSHKVKITFVYLYICVDLCIMHIFVKHVHKCVCTCGETTCWNKKKIMRDNVPEFLSSMTLLNLILFLTDIYCWYNKNYPRSNKNPVFKSNKICLIMFYITYSLK